MPKFTTEDSVASPPPVEVSIRSDDQDVNFYLTVNGARIRVAWFSEGSGKLRLQSLTDHWADTLRGAGVQLREGTDGAYQIVAEGF